MGTTPTSLILLNPFSPEYQKQQLIANLKQQADTTNANAAVTYLRTSQDWLVNAVIARDSGRPIPPIADPPLKIHVDDLGNGTSGPDFVAAKPTLPAPSGAPSTGGISNPNAAPDRIDQLLSGMSAMYTLVMQLQAEVQSLKVKFGA